MAFISSQGSLDQTSTRTDPVRLRPEVVDNRPVVDNEAINAERAIRDTFLANTSVNTDAFNNELSLLAGYPEGSIIHVTWYSQQQALTNIRSMNVERLTADSDTTHRSYVQIRNFELRLKNAFDYSFDNDSNVSTFSGEAVVLAGFSPLVNDIFLYKLRNDKIGVFVITNVERTSLGNDTYHHVKFNLTSYLTPDYREKLTSQTTVVMYFDKVKFLAGNHAFLTSDNYTLQKDLKHIRQEIIDDYYNRFFTRKYNSFLRPDKVYDPYIVTYWNKKIPITETGYRPVQMLVTESAYNKTIWALLTGTAIRKIKNLEHGFRILTKRYSTWDTNLNGLVDNKVLLIGDDITFEIGAEQERKAMHAYYVATPYFPYAQEDIIRRLSAEHKHWYGEHHKPHEHTPDHDLHPDPECEVCHLKWHAHIHKKKIEHSFGECYALSKAFYQGSAEMTTLESLIYDNIMNREIPAERILQTVDEYLDWDNDRAFYQHLLAIHLIDYAQHWIVHRS